MKINEILSQLNVELGKTELDKKTIISDINLLTKSYNQMIASLKEKSEQTDVTELKEEIKKSEIKFKKKSIDLNTIFEIAKDLSSSLSLNKLMKTIILTSIGHLLVETGVVFIYDDKLQKYIFSDTKGIKEDLSDVSFHCDEELIKYLSKELKPIEFKKLSGEKFFPQYKDVLKKLHCELIVPIFIKNKLNGILFLGTRVSGMPYTDANLEFLIALGNFASIAIENAKLYEDIDRKMKDLSTLYNISREINKSVYIDIAIKLMLETITTGYGVEKCSIILFNELKKVYYIERNFNIAEKEAQTYLNIVLEKKLENPLDQESPDILYNNKIFSNGDIYFSVPLIAGNKKVGLLNIYRFKNQIIIDEDVKQIFSIIASQMAPPILFTQLLSKSEKYRENPFDYIYNVLSDNVERSNNSGVGFIASRIQFISNEIDFPKIKNLIQQIMALLQESDFLIHSNYNEIMIVFPATSKQEIDTLLSSFITSIADFKVKYNIISYPDEANNLEILLNKLFSN